MLGWDGLVVGPVEFGGARFWAVASGSEFGPEVQSDVVLQGALFHGRAPGELMREASLLAAYTARAVLVSDSSDLTELMITWHNRAMQRQARKKRLEREDEGDDWGE